jgi:carbamate kinase
MRLVVAVGGNALLERGDVPTASVQEGHVHVAVHALSAIARAHDLVLTHGNGPQVGLLANESALDTDLPAPYPFDVLGAQTQGMIGYLFLQAFENELPGRMIVSLVCQTEVDADDHAFDTPTKFVGPVYSAQEAARLASTRGWQVRPDGERWRRVVASPEPRAMLELATIRTLLADGAVVICAGGGGVPVVRGADGAFHGVEAVIDKDLSASLLAIELGADALMILTDVANVVAGYGTPSAGPIGLTTPAMLRALEFPAGSMGPKVEAACRFVEATGKPAMIGRLDDAAGLLDETCGTVVRRTLAPRRRGRGIAISARAQLPTRSRGGSRVRPAGSV